jgi:hypothetical protein
MDDLDFQRRDWEREIYKKCDEEDARANHLYGLGHSKDCVDRMLDGDWCSCMCNVDTAGM